MALKLEQLLDAAIRQDMIQKQALDGLRIESRRKRLALMDVVKAHYRLPESAFYRAAANVRHMPYISFSDMAHIDYDALKKIPSALIKRKGFLPLKNEDELTLATFDPDDKASIDTVRRLLAKPVQVALSEPSILQAAMQRADSSIGTLESDASEEPDLVALLDNIFREAYLRRSSDIHIMQDEYGLRIRLRVDGELQDYFPAGAHTDVVANGLISRVKVLADLDIAEQREPQDGGLSYTLSAPINTEFNVRVATAPTRVGERITMRILGQDAQDLSLAKIGMAEDDLARFQASIRKPFGMILLTGPTGSGKSTTLFAALREISSPRINIMTVENPIEYVMDDVSQIQTGAKVSFASALRSLLRHDPDVLMVGEIRDEETADTALKAAMTGHLVFSTLHTNTAAGCISRLADIGCEPFLIGSTMNAVIAQRLVRRLCNHCKTEHDASDEEKALLEVEQSAPLKLYEPVGCALCEGTGYKGRLGLFETLWFDEGLSKLVSRGCSEEELEAQAGDRLRHMWEDGVSKVLSGITTLEEIQTVTIKRQLNG